jgi:hypothetical protein
MPEDPTEFFQERGFELTFSRHTDEELAAIYTETTARLPRNVRKSVSRALADGRIGPVFADLHGPNGQVLRGYGTGANEGFAGARAVQRWKQEQGA